MGFDFVNARILEPSSSNTYAPPTRVTITFQSGTWSGPGGAGGATSGSLIFLNGILISTGSNIL